MARRAQILPAGEPRCARTRPRRRPDAGQGRSPHGCGGTDARGSHGRRSHRRARVPEGPGQGRRASWAEVAGWVATVAAVAALAVPGANVAAASYLAATALGATAVSAAGHGALLSAGHASKLDLGLDIFALATFGAGRVVASGLRSTQAATRTAAAQAARRAARDASLDASRPTREAAGRVLTDPRSTSGARRGARDRIDLAHDQARRAGTQAARDGHHTPLAEATRAEPAPCLTQGTPTTSAHCELPSHRTRALRGQRRMPSGSPVSAGHRSSRASALRQWTELSTIGTRRSRIWRSNAA